MNENIMDSTEFIEEIVVSDTETVEDDTSNGTDDMESVSDTDSGNDSSSDISDVTGLSDYNDRYDEELGGYPVYIVNDDIQNLSQNDIAPTASYYNFYTYLPSEIADYFSGILANMKDTDYIAYSYRAYDSDGHSSYVDYYRLVYDIKLDSDNIIYGEYPSIQITKNTGFSGHYVRLDSVYNLTTVPDFAYGSFGTLSDLRKGASHDETYTFLFIAGFFICSFVLRNIFSCICKSH